MSMSSHMSRSLSRGAERGEGGKDREEGGGRENEIWSYRNCKICLLATFFTKSFNLPHTLCIWNEKKENVTTQHPPTPQAHTPSLSEPRWEHRT